jgi:hypothetical protein
VLADAQPAVLLAGVSVAVVLADARTVELLASASVAAAVLADARPAALLAQVQVRGRTRRTHHMLEEASHHTCDLIPAKEEAPRTRLSSCRSVTFLPRIS